MAGGEIAHILDVERLGLATYFLAIIYVLLSINSAIKLKKISAFVQGWNGQKLFNVFVLIHLFVRALSFSVLCIFSILKTKVWYPILVMLFTIPEYVILSTYAILFFHWLEIYIFSHEQFVVPSRAIFRTKWKCVFWVLTVILYALLTTLYVLLSVRPDQAQDNVFNIIEYTAAIGCFILPGLMGVVSYYFAFFMLSGFPFASSIQREQVAKINTVFGLWTIGRIARGVLLVISIEDNWQQTLDSIYLGMVVVSILAVSEFFPFMLVLDEGITRVLLLGEEAQKLRTRSPDGYGGLAQVEEDRQDLQSRWAIDVAQLRFAPDIIEDKGVSFTQKGTWNGRPISIKAFRFPEMSRQMVDELVTDLVEFSSLDHPNIVQFLGISRVESTVYQITEFLPRGSLFDVIRQSKKQFSAFTILKMAREIASAMAFMHSQGQIHAHLKSTNCLLDAHMSVKVGEIGVRRLKAFAEVMLVERMATAWSAPEVLAGLAATERSDVWSFGIICWELLARNEPFGGMELSTITSILKRGDRLRFPSDVDPALPASFITLVVRCWDRDPAARPSFESILKTLEECHEHDASLLSSTTVAVSSNSTTGAPLSSISSR